MAFLTIEIKCKNAEGEMEEYIFPEARQHSLRRAVQTYLSNELKRDFGVLAVELVEHTKGNLIVAACEEPLDERPLTKDENAFLNQLAGMLAPDYIVSNTGDISTTAGTPIPGLGIDWRGCMMVAKEQGSNFLIGLVETVRDGAAKILAAQEENPNA